MNILVGCSSPPDVGAGGILTYTKEIVEAMIDLGHVIHIAAPQPEDWGWVKEFDVKFIETSQYEDPVKETKKLLQYVETNKIQGIINNDNPYVQSILPVVNVPSVVVGHLGESVIASLACYQSQWSDYVVAISNDMYTSYVTNYDVPVTKCPIIYNGVKDPGDKLVHSDESSPIKVVFAGGSNKRKGCDHIMNMIKKYPNRFSNVELNWYGNVSEQIRKQFSEYSFVNFQGRKSRNDFIDDLKSSDLLLFPSKSEGCPMAMLEAMSYGVITIASDGRGAMDALVTNGQEGYICHLDRWADEASKCLSFLSAQRAILRDMKVRSREKFVTHYKSENVVKSLLELIQNPTVDRTNSPKKINVLRWHRPVPKGRNKATLINRIRYKLGYLQVAARLSI